MTLQHFIAKLNWRQILMHSIAFWFFIHAFQTLSYLYDTKLIDIVRQSNGQFNDQALGGNKIEASHLTYFVLWTSISGFVGLLVAFIISLTISIKRHWFWVNSLLAVLLMYSLYRFELLGWAYLKQFFWYLGQKFNNSTGEFLLNGVILLIIALFIFFLKQTNQFIEAKKLASA
jgi:hypothetical protein